jgi:hypothetical protein
LIAHLIQVRGFAAAVDRNYHEGLLPALRKTMAPLSAAAEDRNPVIVSTRASCRIDQRLPFVAAEDRNHFRDGTLYTGGTRCGR